MNTESMKDFWSQEDFEETVSSALISCFETKIKKLKGAPPGDRLTEERLFSIRQTGPYIASSSRLLTAEAYDEEDILKTCWGFDMQNDTLPESGCYTILPEGKTAECNPDTYAITVHFKKATSLGKYWHQQSGGTLYELTFIYALKAGGIMGERRYITVDKNGVIFPCKQKFQSPIGYHKHEVIETEPVILKETEMMGSIVLQISADRRFCWAITAQEAKAKVHLGCMQEEIKSLLYARSLPVTETGRKRPVLHLIESHKRRLKSGIDIDVTSYLRGQQSVEINGTRFQINPPAVMKNKLSINSQTKYY